VEILKSDVWHEAHIIRRRATSLYRTVFELSANFRWCLTGTPIQNRLEDIGALFAFIRACPFDSMATFRRFIAIPFEDGEQGRTISSQRLGLLLDSICLRRTKDLLGLPDWQDKTRAVEFSREERKQYEQTKKIMVRAIRQNAGGVDKKSLFGMFQAQLQLRILCNHGTFQHPFSWASKRNLLSEREDALYLAGQNGEINCSSCRQSMPILGTNRVYRTYTERCAHVLCLECLDEKAQEDSADDSSTPSRCPLCYPPCVRRTPVGVYGSSLGEEEPEDGYFRDLGHSSKMTALILDVQQDLRTTKRQVKT
jgi:SWI/SNF-related matrix-associated actin-dependent regulator of chromatin subfamily A3